MSSDLRSIFGLILKEDAIGRSSASSGGSAQDRHGPGWKGGKFQPMAAPKGMKMPRPSEEAKAALARIVPGEPAVTLKPMFGQLSGFVNGNMFVGIFGEDLFVRLPEDELEAVKKQGGRDFEPMRGHEMGGYVIVPGDWRAKPAPAVALVNKAVAAAGAARAK